jgi:hypothetical protein
LNRDDGYTLEVNTADSPFSISSFHLSTSRDTDVLITYEMPHGRPCRQIAFSSRQGTDVHNEQCGGATSVKFQLPEESKFGECTLDIHSINFDCSAGPKNPGHPDDSWSEPQPEPTHSVPTVPVPVDSWSEPQPEPTHSVPTVPVPVHEHHTTSTVEVTSPPAPVHEHHPTTVVVVPSPPKPMTTVWATTEVTITNCGPTVTDCPAHSTVVRHSTYTLSTTTCPSQTTEISAGHPSPPPPPPAPVTTSPATTPAPCPELVPKCLNTWLSVPKCDSNSDAACFCPSSEFTDKVQSCIHAWGSSKHEVDSALSYFAGICAPYVPQNPSIIDIVPTPVPTAVHTEPQPAGTPCTTLTWSSHTVTVPQVGFNTVTGSSTTSVCLTAGTPASVPVPSETGHKEHSWSSTSTSTLSTTAPCSTHTSTFYTTIAPKTTGHHPTTTKPASKPTETVVHANAGVKPVISGIWAFGVMFLVLALN